MLESTPCAHIAFSSPCLFNKIPSFQLLSCAARLESKNAANDLQCEEDQLITGQRPREIRRIIDAQEDNSTVWVLKACTTRVCGEISSMIPERWGYVLRFGKSDVLPQPSGFVLLGSVKKKTIDSLSFLSLRFGCYLSLKCSEVLDCQILTTQRYQAI